MNDGKRPSNAVIGIHLTQYTRQAPCGKNPKKNQTITFSTGIPEISLLLRNASVYPFFEQNRNLKEYVIGRNKSSRRLPRIILRGESSSEKKKPRKVGEPPGASPVNAGEGTPVTTASRVPNYQSSPSWSSPWHVPVHVLAVGL